MIVPRIPSLLLTLALAACSTSHPLPSECETARNGDPCTGDWTCPSPSSDMHERACEEGTVVERAWPEVSPGAPVRTECSPGTAAGDPCDGTWACDPTALWSDTLGTRWAQLRCETGLVIDDRWMERVDFTVGCEPAAAEGAACSEAWVCDPVAEGATAWSRRACRDGQVEVDRWSSTQAGPGATCAAVRVERIGESEDRCERPSMVAAQGALIAGWASRNGAALLARRPMGDAWALQRNPFAQSLFGTPIERVELLGDSALVQYRDDAVPIQNTLELWSLSELPDRIATLDGIQSVAHGRPMARWGERHDVLAIRTRRDFGEPTFDVLRTTSDDEGNRHESLVEGGDIRALEVTTDERGDLHTLYMDGDALLLAGPSGVARVSDRRPLYGPFGRAIAGAPLMLARGGEVDLLARFGTGEVIDHRLLHHSAERGWSERVYATDEGQRTGCAADPAEGDLCEVDRVHYEGASAVFDVDGAPIVLATRVHERGTLLYGCALGPELPEYCEWNWRESPAVDAELVTTHAEAGGSTLVPVGIEVGQDARLAAVTDDGTVHLIMARDRFRDGRYGCVVEHAVLACE